MDDFTSDVEGVWSQYLETGAEEASYPLVLHYAPMVRFAAERVPSEMPSEQRLETAFAVLRNEIAAGPDGITERLFEGVWEAIADVPEPGIL